MGDRRSQIISGLRGAECSESDPLGDPATIYSAGFGDGERSSSSTSTPIKFKFKVNIDGQKKIFSRTSGSAKKTKRPHSA